MTDKIAIGVIGGGFGKRVLLPVCLKHQRLVVKWLATKNLLPTEVPSGLRTTLCWEDVLEDTEVHAVVIATPHDMHSEHVSAFLSAGKHVLCEKPLALNAKEAVALAVKCETAKLVGMVDYSFRYIPERSFFRDAIVRGTIGNLKLLRLSFFRNDLDRWPSKWYYDRARGGGALIATGSHLVDAIRWLTQSEVRWVNAVVSFEGELDVGFSATMETESGCICSVDVSHRVPGAGKHTIEANGDKGTLLLNEGGQVVKTENGDVTALVVSDQYRLGFGEVPWSDDPKLQPTARVVDLFTRCILEPTTIVPMNFWTAAKNQLVMEAIQASHTKGERVKVERIHP